MRASRIALLLLLGAFGLRFAMHFAALPPVVASHFGVDGAPNGWMSKSVFLLFTLIPIGVVIIVAFLAPWMTSRMPVELINLPNKDYWLAPERKHQGLAKLGQHLEWFSTALVAFLIFVYELVFKANAEQTGLANGPFLIGLGLFFAFVTVFLVTLYRSFAIPKA
jgi:uncharacterized membrane protein